MSPKYRKTIFFGPRPAGGLGAPEGQGGVESAKREGIRQAVLGLEWPGLVGNIVEIAGRVGLAVVDGGRRHASSQREYRRRRLQRRRCAQRMPVHGLGRTDGQLLRM